MSEEVQGKSRVLPPVYCLVAFIAMVGLHLLLPVVQVIGSPLRYSGLLVMAASLALVLWAAGLFAKAGTTRKPFRESSALVLDGPFRFTRNPMYVGLAGGLLGIAVLLGSVTPFVVLPLFGALIDSRFIRAEEAMLEKSFGDSYRAYKGRVRRWL